MDQSRGVKFKEGCSSLGCRRDRPSCDPTNAGGSKRIAGVFGKTFHPPAHIQSWHATQPKNQRFCRCESGKRVDHRIISACRSRIPGEGSLNKRPDAIHTNCSTFARIGDAHGRISTVSSLKIFAGQLQLFDFHQNASLFGASFGPLQSG